MLSNPTRNLQARQRATHRRQNSTPSAFEAAKVPALPNVQQQRQRALGHRRGLSLDTRRQAMSPTHANTTALTTTTTTKTSASINTINNNNNTPTRQDFTTVSNNTNTGLATNSPQHHVLREAQQQRIQARPGPPGQQQQQQQQLHPNLHLFQQQQHFMTAAEHDTYLMSPHGTPQHQRFDPSCFDASPVSYDPFSGSQGLDVMVPMSEKDFDMFGNDSALSTPSFLTFNESPTGNPGWHSEGDVGSDADAGSRRGSRRISNGIMDRVNKFETMGMDGAPSSQCQSQRPMTPPSHQNVNGYFPPTPMETPHDRLVKHEPVSVPRPNRFSEGYDESMEETLKPVRSRSNQRTQTIFEEMRRRAEQPDSTSSSSSSMVQGQSSAPEAAQIPTADFMSMNNFNSEFLKIQTSGFQGTPDDVHSSSTPHTPHSNFRFGNHPLDNKPNFQATHMDSPVSSADGTPHRGSPHRRTDSLASLASAASIADINIEETKTDTGITLDDISNYISGPDASDNKWLCLYEGCGKRFGRKENIKSHVQTHLNDRQYQCPSCQKCFVRQHDLKRHAKIHTGIKPYPCECGNSFARHDALTRHRQRGMCIGAFDGIVKKVVKRGRPRKHRPDMDERVDKATRTRHKNKSPSSSSSSSQSGYSDTSVANSPENDFNHGLSDDPFNAVMDVDINIKQEHAPPLMMMTSQIASISSATMPSLPAPVMAPVPESALSGSPSSSSHHHSPYVSPEEIMEPNSATLSRFADQDQDRTAAAAASSPTKSTPSQYNTPPELSQSSSPPPNQYFDAEPNSSSFADDSLLASMRSTAAGTSSSGALVANTSLSGFGLGEADDELLMKAFTTDDDDGGLGSVSMSFDRDPSQVLMMSKFDEFDDAVDMFTNTDDVFFGTS